MMRKLSIAVATSLLAAAALVAAAPVSAQRMSLAERIGVLEQQAGNNDATVDLLRQVNMLKDEVTSLRSQVEELNHSMDQLKTTSRAQFLDMDERLEELESGGATPRSPSARVEPAVSAPVSPVSERPPSVRGDAGKLAAGADEQATYDAAFTVLKNGDYVESARLFHSFLGHYPAGVYAPNALYWLGESFYVTQNYKLAVEQFQALLQRYPTHDKASGALLKIGLAEQGLGQVEAAERTLTEVTTRFAGSDAARIATDRLGAIQLGRLN